MGCIAKTILVVDDESDIRDALALILKKQGYNVITAVNGDNCLNILQNETPDLILLDVMMPGTPVKEIIKQIQNIKIAFLSVVRTTEAEKQDFLNQENVVDYIQKPFDVNDLIKRIEAILND